MSTVPKFNDFQPRFFDLFPDGQWNREGPKLPRNAPADPSRKRTCIDPLGYLVVESAPFAPIDFAQDGPSEHPFALLSGTCERIPVVLRFIKLCAMEVLMG